MLSLHPSVITVILFISFLIDLLFAINFLTVAGRAAFIGVGFGDRSDSFDLNVALQDHFKWVKKEEEAEKEKVEGKPNLDLGFKDGQTIKINMKITVRMFF